MFKAKDKGAWSEALLLQRRPTNVAIVALANKAARTARAIRPISVATKRVVSTEPT